MRLPLRGFLLTAAALVGLSCTEPETLRLDISLDRTSLTPTDSVLVSLTLVNHGWRPKMAMPGEAYGRECSARGYRVVNSVNREVVAPTTICGDFLAELLALDPIELAPGASISIHVFWRPLGSSIDGQPLPPGSYRIIGSVGGDNREVMSAPAQITLLQ